jgi:hypothetical protein
MNSADDRRLSDFHKAAQSDYPMLVSFSVTRVRHGDISARIVTASIDEAASIVMTFAGVRELRIEWPDWDEIRLDVIDIGPVSDRGWEGIAFRVHEGAGFFAFWCRDLAVAEAACEHAVRQYFGPGNDVRAVTAFARRLREASGEDLGGGLMQTEAVIRTALGEAGIDVNGISASSRFRIHTVAITYMSRSLQLDETAIDVLLVAAEADVLRLGSRPLLVSPGSGR